MTARMIVVLVGAGFMTLTTAGAARPDEDSAGQSYLLGVTLLRSGELDIAIRAFDDALRANPKHVPAIVERGRARLYKGDLDKAIEDFGEAIKLDPKDAEVFKLRAGAYLSKGSGEVDRAIRDLDAAIDLDAADSALFAIRGGAWAKKQDWDRAVRDAEKAIDLDERNALAFYVRGTGRAGKGDLDSAIRDLDRSARLAPHYAEVFMTRAWIWFQKQEWDKVVADSTEAIRLAPGCAEALSYRAWVRASCPEAKHRDGKKAIEDAKRACDLTKWKNPAYVECLAAAYAEAEEYGEAVKWQGKALLDPAYAGTMGDSGRARYKLYEQKKPFRANTQIPPGYPRGQR